jgi:hypothetical protein
MQSFRLLLLTSETMIGAMPRIWVLFCCAHAMTLAKYTVPAEFKSTVMAESYCYSDCEIVRMLKLRALAVEKCSRCSDEGMPGPGGTDDATAWFNLQ